MADDQHDDADAQPAPKARKPKTLKGTFEVHQDGTVDFKLGNEVISHGQVIPVAWIEAKRAVVRAVEETDGFELNY